jgi:IMP dehydrogenase
MDKIIGEGLTFDDVLIVPSLSDIKPGEADVSVNLTPSIRLNIPIMSAGMDTVTESTMAIAIARQGGIGIIHRNLSITDQACEVDRVKRSEHSIINDPFTLSPNHYVSEAIELMEKYHISGIPITEHGKLAGIITNRDLRFETDYSKKIYEVMTRDNLITAPPGTTLEDAKVILTKHKVEKLPIVDGKGNLLGLITVKDIRKFTLFPNASRDAQGRLLAGASLSISDDIIERVEALAAAGVDVLALDILRAYSKPVLRFIREIKDNFPQIALIAGNVAAGKDAAQVIEAGADAVKVGIGPSSISTMRVVAGVGVPQITAIMDCVEAAKAFGKPVIADGGIRYSGDITKAIAAGAHVCMLGNLLAGCEESPGTTQIFKGRKFKEYRGMESSAKRRTDISEGIEGRTLYKGTVADVMAQLMGGLKTGMAYCGCRTVAELHEQARLIKITGSGLRENHPHDVQIIRESSNYSIE